MAEGSTLKVAVVSAERLLWQGEAKSVVAKTPEGEIGILPGHEPVLALLLESPLRIEGPDGNKMMVAVHGGFFSVDSNKVNVIAEVAELAEFAEFAVFAELAEWAVFAVLAELAELALANWIDMMVKLIFLRLIMLTTYHL